METQGYARKRASPGLRNSRTFGPQCSGARARKLRSSASVRLIPRDGMSHTEVSIEIALIVAWKTAAQIESDPVTESPEGPGFRHSAIRLCYYAGQRPVQFTSPVAQSHLLRTRNPPRGRAQSCHHGTAAFTFFSLYIDRTIQPHGVHSMTRRTRRVWDSAMGRGSRTVTEMRPPSATPTVTVPVQAKPGALVAMVVQVAGFRPSETCAW